MDMGVHGALDTSNRPAQRQDSATFVIVLTPYCPASNVLFVSMKHLTTSFRAVAKLWSAAPARCSARIGFVEINISEVDERRMRTG